MQLRNRLEWILSLKKRTHGRRWTHGRKNTHGIVVHALKIHLCTIHRWLTIHSKKIRAKVLSCSIKSSRLFSLCRPHIRQPIHWAVNHRRAHEHTDRSTSNGKSQNGNGFDSLARIESAKMFGPDNFEPMLIWCVAVLIRSSERYNRSDNPIRDPLWFLADRQNPVVKYCPHHRIYIPNYPKLIHRILRFRRLDPVWGKKGFGQNMDINIDMNINIKSMQFYHFK